MLIRREYGKEQPHIKAGIFKIRLPFIHYRWEMPECIQAALMCAACLGIIPITQQYLGTSFEVAWSLCIINGLCYCLHSLLGDPVIPGWITPSLPLTYMYLLTYPIGPERTQALIAVELLVAFIFLFLGLTGIAGKVMKAIPRPIKAGVLFGAAMGAIQGEFAVGTGRINTLPISLTCGIIVAYLLLYSDWFRTYSFKHKWAYIMRNYGMLGAIIIALIVGPLVGELPVPTIELGTIIKIPEISNVMHAISPFYIGFPSVQKFISGIPLALAIYIIAFGDFLTVESVLKEADTVREDEMIDFNPNRSNIISGIRNLIMALVAPHTGMCGPLWGAPTVSVGERYKNGPEAMESIFSGYGTFRVTTMIAVAIYPIVSIVKPVLGLSIGISLMVQGYVCIRLGMESCEGDTTTMSIAGVMGCVMATKGSAWGLAVGFMLFFLITELKKVKKSSSDIHEAKV